MKLDFNKPAPQAQTLEEAQQIINALWAIIVELQAEVADLKEKLNTNSQNSSKSPSSDNFKTKKKKQPVEELKAYIQQQPFIFQADSIYH